MKTTVLLIFTTTWIAQLCAHPTADTVPAAATNATKAAEAALAAAKAKNPLQAPNATDLLSKLPKDGHGPLNPADIIKKGTEFISTVVSACENFIKSIFKLCPSSSVPGLDNLSKLTNIFKPTDVANMTKNMMDDMMKVFNLSPTSLASPDALSKAKDGLPANATDPLKKLPKDAPTKVADGLPGKDLLSTAVKAGSSAIDDALNIFG